MSGAKRKQAAEVKPSADEPPKEGKVKEQGLRERQAAQLEPKPPVKARARGYYVTAGNSICGTPRGMRDAGDNVLAEDFGEGEEAIKRLEARGVLEYDDGGPKGNSD